MGLAGRASQSSKCSQPSGSLINTLRSPFLALFLRRQRHTKLQRTFPRSLPASTNPRLNYSFQLFLPNNPHPLRASAKTPARTTSAKINVYLTDGKLITFIDRVDRRKAVFMSRTIREQLDNGGVREPQMNDKEGVLFSDQDIDRNSLEILINYINTYDTYGDWVTQAFTSKHIKSEDLQKLIRVYRGLYVFQIKKALAGGVFRQELLERLHVKEFSTVYELTAFDVTIFTAMPHAFTDFKVGLKEVKEAEAIEKDIYDIGFGKKLQGIEYFVKRKLAEAAETSRAMEEKPAPAVQPVPVSVWVKRRQI